MIQWTEKEVAVADLKSYERNPRKISDAAFARLINDIKVNGYHQRIIATQDLRVIGGHQRRKALESLGITKIKVLIPDQKIDDKKFREILVKDNLAFGEFDLEILAEDFSLEELLGYGMSENLLAGLMVGQIPLPELSDAEKMGFQQMTFTLSNEQAENVNAAMKKSKKLGEFVDIGNENSNGNAISRICELFLGKNV